MKADLFRQLAKPTLLDRLIGWANPHAGLRRHQARQLLTRAYHAASPSDSWRPKRATASANTDHMADAAALRAKSRSLIQNVDYIAAGMNARVAHTVGTGIIPKWGGQDGPKLKALWDQWAPVCDADGVHDIYGLQAAAARAMDADGEVLVRLRPRLPTDNLPVPLQLQLLEIDWLDSARQTSDKGNQVINGKEYDALGRCVAYYLWSQHPGDIMLLKSKGLVSQRVPAEQIIHLFAPTRPGQSRGFPRLSPVITRVRDLQLLEDAEMARKNQESRLSVVASGDVAGMANPQFGETSDSAVVRATGDLGQLAGGGITQLPPGLNISVIEPKAAPGFVEYCKYNIGLTCAGGGFTYEWATGDMTRVNFSSARIRQNDIRREIEQLQWLTLIPQLCARICREFVAYAVLGGHFKRAPVYTLEHSTPKWDYVNPKQDIEADLAEIAGGLSSISEKLRRRGYDPETVFNELEKDIKGLQARGIWDAVVLLLKGKEIRDGLAGKDPAANE